MTEIWQRTLSIYMDVPIEWLLPNGECLTKDNAVAADAWEELLNDVRAAIDKKFPAHTAYPRPTFNIDWEDKPERKET